MKSINTVQKALEEKGFTACKVVELASSTRTAIEAAQTIGCEVAHIVKSLLFRTKNTQVPILILVSGKNRVNEKSIEAQVGEKIEKADADFTRYVTGFAIGGIPPLGHKQQIDHVFIDQELLTFETIWAAAGTPYAVFSMPSNLLVAATNGKLIKLQ